MIPAVAVISLRQSLTVHHGPDPKFRYMGTLRTPPITNLCPLRAPMIDVEKPSVIHWPAPSTDGLTSKGRHRHVTAKCPHRYYAAGALNGGHLEFYPRSEIVEDHLTPTSVLARLVTRCSGPQASSP